MASPSEARTKPFVGPEPFGEHDQSVFFGREHESDDLYSLILAYREVLLFAQSGAGKTSLISAGLLPRLKAVQKFEILPPARIGGTLPAGLDAEGIVNVFTFNMLRSLRPEADPETLVKLSVSDFLEFSPRNTNSDQARADDMIDRMLPNPEQTVDLADLAPVPPPDAAPPRRIILIIDQFEEIFDQFPERRAHRRE